VSSFAHPQQTQRSPILQRLLADARPVVFYGEGQRFVRRSEAHGHACRFRVPRHVGERFLQDAEDGGRAISIQGQFIDPDVEFMRQTCARSEVLDIPFDRGNQAQVVEYRRSPDGLRGAPRPR
jgi:hypothetical protein